MVGPLFPMSDIVSANVGDIFAIVSADKPYTKLVEGGSLQNWDEALLVLDEGKLLKISPGGTYVVANKYLFLDNIRVGQYTLKGKITSDQEAELTKIARKLTKLDHWRITKMVSKDKDMSSIGRFDLEFVPIIKQVYGHIGYPLSNVNESETELSMLLDFSREFVRIR